MMYVLLIIFLSTHASDVAGKDHGDCQDPPWLNPVGQLIVEEMEAARVIIQNGIPDLGIPPLDPLGPLPRVPFTVDTPTMWMEGEANYTMMTGLAEYEVCALNWTFGLSQEMTMDFRYSDLVISGKYSLNGLVAQLFPIYGQGRFNLKIDGAGFISGADSIYNPTTDHVTISNLYVNMWYENLNLELECIMGCGDMADMVNGFVSEMAVPIFEAIMSVVDPILSNALEAGINNILKDVDITDILGRK